MASNIARSLSGFPEWTPEVRYVEVMWLDRIRKVYESYGYTSIETPAVELLEILQAKGEIDKEIYLIKKPYEGSKEEYGLHYDLTVPFARYVAQNHGKLTFPFKRYQMQKVWRGERPQRGRYREFYQCDVDVIDNETLSHYYDFEMLLVGHDALSCIEIPCFTIGISNRKIYQGYLEAVGIKDVTSTLRLIDKMDKVGSEGVIKLLKDKLDMPEELAVKAIQPSSIKSSDLGFIEQFQALDVKSTLADEGIQELEQVISLFIQTGRKNVEVDLSFVRGFDYYTGIIYEGKFSNDPGYGSICSGGRYENLSGSFTDRRLPGVGFSVGFTRIFAKLVEEELLPTIQSSLVDAIVLRTQEDDLPSVCKAADVLRSKGLKVEVYGEVCKLAKQFKYANKKSIRWVWIASKDDPTQFEVKDMMSGEQYPSSPENWQPLITGIGS
ncbi:MAG: histidine--tRNA ligase [Microcoleus sp.]